MLASPKVIQIWPEEPLRIFYKLLLQFHSGEMAEFLYSQDTHQVLISSSTSPQVYVVVYTQSVWLISARQILARDKVHAYLINFAMANASVQIYIILPTMLPNPQGNPQLIWLISKCIHVQFSIFSSSSFGSPFRANRLRTDQLLQQQHCIIHDKHTIDTSAGKWSMGYYLHR